MDFTPYIREVPDFPQPGVLFRDITPLLADAEAFDSAIEAMQEAAAAREPRAIVAIESRGFLFGAPLANRMGLPMVLVRKPGKLPAAHMTVEYALEYGENQLDIHSDALAPGSRAYIVDDLLATGGTAQATAKLAKSLGADICGLAFVVELDFLNGREKLKDYDVVSLLHYDK